MSTLIITRGLPGSGKTTWAQEWVAEDPKNRARVNRDDLRFMHYQRNEGLSWQQENLITQASQALCKIYLDAGKDVVADDMNLRLHDVREWDKFARANGADFEIKEFEISVDESKERNRAREARGERFVNWKAIQGMSRRYLYKNPSSGQWNLMPYEPLLDGPKVEVDPNVVEPYVADETKPCAIIVDLDGTIALNTEGRDWYDVSRVLEDSLCGPVDDVVSSAWWRSQYRIIFLSGRQETAEADTRTWLWSKAGWLDRDYDLHMRAAGDGRPDFIVKRELFDKHIRHEFNVQYVIDDRPSVCRMWRELGLFTFQVGDPHHEF